MHACMHAQDLMAERNGLRAGRHWVPGRASKALHTRRLLRCGVVLLGIHASGPALLNLPSSLSPLTHRHEQARRAGRVNVVDVRHHQHLRRGRGGADGVEVDGAVKGGECHKRALAACKPRQVTPASQVRGVL